ncbi:hypothetical protein ACVWYQ_006705 [Bradyrhizobium sp. USDA 3397]
MDHQRCRTRRRPLEPEGLEERKFLALGFARIDRKSPGGEPVRLPLGHGAEIARAQEDADLVVIVGTVHRRMDAEARESEIAVLERRDLLAEGEVRLAVLELGCLSVRHLEDVHPVLVEEAAVEELRLERKILAAPERPLGQKADRTILIVIQVLQSARELLVRRLVGLARQLPCQVPHGGRTEHVVRRRGQTASGSEQQRRQHCRPLNKLASVHVLSLLATAAPAKQTTITHASSNRPSSTLARRPREIAG